MSLAPGEAYSYLVGVTPTNLVAQTAGKLRVDAGNPANSFILDKLHGDLVPGEGDPMPLQLKRLPDNAILLIEEWIAAMKVPVQPPADWAQVGGGRRLGAALGEPRRPCA